MTLPFGIDDMIFLLAIWNRGYGWLGCVANARAAHRQCLLWNETRRMS